MHDLPSLFRKLHRHLHSQGLLAISLYGTHNLIEIRDITQIGLAYDSLCTIREYISECFTVLKDFESRNLLFFPSPMAVLQHLRQTGVKRYRRQGMDAEAVKAVLSMSMNSAFQTNRASDLPINPMYIIAAPNKMA